MKRLVVVGGGISGLAAAHAAVEAAAGLDGGLQVTLLEREAEVGGKARTLDEDGWRVEAGPTAWLGGDDAVDRLVAAAGLQEQVVAADAAAARRFVVRGGRLREIHLHPLRFACAGILGPTGLARLAREPFVPPAVSEYDESVWGFANRRLGRQVADRLIAPMVGGVFAGNAHRLSLAAAFPKLAALEAEHGSLIRGMFALRKARRARAANASGAGGPAGPTAPMLSFREGLQSLPRALAADGRFEVRCGVGATALARVPPDGWRVSLDGGAALAADAVILAGEPWAMAEILRAAEPKLAHSLDAMRCPPVSVVALGYGPEALRRVPKGFGVLVPREESPRILGCLWDSYLFAGRSPDGTLLVRAMAGGSIDPRFAELDDAELIAAVQEELAALLGLAEPPRYSRVVRWPRSIPQYELGHLDRVRAIEAELSRAPGLHLAGNALHGIAFGKAAAAGLACGERSVAGLSARSAAIGA